METQTRAQGGRFLFEGKKKNPKQKMLDLNYNLFPAPRWKKLIF